jgi:succinate dehydrogenase / fumarate reductase cytochrome b subunit
MATTVIAAREIRPARFWESTNGKKVVMAVTGVLLFAFVIGHMIGNLQAFEGPEKLNAYGRFLHSIPEILYPVRVGLLLAVGLHIWAATGLALKNYSARPIAYASKKNVHSSYASRTMYWSGPILLAFIIFHILHLTAGVIQPGSGYVEGDVYHNVVAGFSVWYVSAWYIFSMILLGLHLRHGVWSMTQSLGFTQPQYTPLLRAVALVFAVVITAGFISIPLGVLTRIIQ